MLEIFVYTNGVLRYKTTGDQNKVEELRNQGFYVETQATHPAQDTSQFITFTPHELSSQKA